VIALARDLREATQHPNIHVFRLPGVLEYQST
jgi:hypothetical protein